VADDDAISRRLAQLEQRVAELEARSSGARPPAAETVRPPLPPRVPPPPPPPPPAPVPTFSPPLRRLAIPGGAEAWLGQRGLLAIGVLALLLAAGYMLKLSFDRGWVSPLVRCVTGSLAGAGLGLLGWRLLPRYRTYGAALVGCGAGICYLAVWAASSLYGFLPPATGIAGLALVSLSLAAVAWAVDVEALAATATAGLLMAPVLLGQEQENGNVLVLYLAVAALALGVVCSLRRWRLTTFLLAAGTIWLGFAAEPSADPLGILGLAALVGTGGLALGLREHWWETRFASFSGGWALVTAAAHRLPIGERWPVIAAALALAVPVWQIELQRPEGAPASAAPSRRNWVAGEQLYFLITPLLVVLALDWVAPSWFAAHPGAAAAMVAVPYVMAGWITRRATFTFVAAAMLVVGALERWSGERAAGALLVLSAVWMIAAPARRWRVALWAALGSYVAAGSRIVEAVDRAAGQPAFTGPWALAMWGAVGVAAGGAYLASRLRTAEWPGTAASSLLPVFGILSASALFLGVTVQLGHLARQQIGSPEVARLAGSLSISAWWILFAATLVLVGFRRRLPRLRLGGLGVAAVAVAKVLFSDLASLDAFYRIGSVFILGIVSLALAWLYHRQARANMENA
jgi:uncharacterized membrane protein